MAGDESFHHRSSLKQTNKPFKSKFTTKGELKIKNKGKVNRSIQYSAKRNEISKADRRNAAKIAQNKKRQEIININRLFSGTNGTPKIIAVVPLCVDVNSVDVTKKFFETVEKDYPVDNDGRPVTLKVERFKQKVQFIQCRKNVNEILDAIKVADYVMFLVSAEEEVDKFGELILLTIKSQGVPTVLTVVQHLEKIPNKKKPEIKKALTTYMEYHFPGEQKIYSIAEKNDCLTLLRQVTMQTPKQLVWREKYSYVLSENIEYDSNENVLKVTGNLRGQQLSVNSLVYLNNYGNFQIQKIEEDIRHDHSNKNGMSVDENSYKRTVYPDPEIQEDLISENEPDPFEGEQTWPTEEELMEAEERVKNMNNMDGVSIPKSVMTNNKEIRKVPKGTSTYQAAWIIDSDDENDSEDDYSDDDMKMEVNQESINNKISEWQSSMNANEEIEPEVNDEEFEELEIPNKDDLFDAQIDEEEEEKAYKEFIEKKNQANMDLEFPDEVDTPLDVPARERFQKYRGLRSFRTSPWDPYENLPVDYSRIFQFENFKRTKARIFKAMKNVSDEDEDKFYVQPGRRISIYIKNVPQSLYDNYNPKKPFIVFSLLPHEQKMCIVNYVITKHSECEEVVKAKDPVVVHCGFRRFVMRPIYSSNTRGGTNNVHKAERFLQPGRSTIATAYAPITYGPAPVLMFKYNENENIEQMPTLIATGSLLNMDTNRIIAKKIVLTGYPFKIHRKSAVIRYMFFNPDDINWFKPIQLTTKYGHVGHIRESIGTHGYMKCIFDGLINQQDTVCMNLYKRIFPKWNTEIYNDEKVDGEYVNVKEDEDMEM
ncbi:DUF663-domain-containing protein [Anaeromyces robustus]|uniref:DUF663-domain-containing protein n=1 Tax=Anaeromyces robustus TaxID=1754192 RepID=A0A1Y1WUR4_9FUNG|nr:DUF663-domain-containing protein [Anaeromyces robustus]|eukprot:ORX77145.1 DUF663-domain-containing protein [Anaeromyces robustus]